MRAWIFIRSVHDADHWTLIQCLMSFMYSPHSDHIRYQSTIVYYVQYYIIMYTPYYYVQTTLRPHKVPEHYYLQTLLAHHGFAHLDTSLN